MEWVTIGIVIGVALWTYFKMPKIPKVTQKPGEIEAPICEDGAPIPVVFGTVCVKGANVTSWGGVETGRMVGGPVDGQLIYYITMRMALCHGPLDAVLKIYIGEKDASGSSLLGPVSSDQVVALKAYKILGEGEGVGDVVGNVRLRMGYPNPILGNNAGVYSKPSEVFGETNGLGPGFFGIACAELERTMVGGSPYLAPWAFVVQRIKWRNNISPLYGYTDQWYPERCYIPHGVTGEPKWSKIQGSSATVPSGDMDDWLTNNIPDDEDGWSETWPMPFGEGDAAPTGLPSFSGTELDYGWSQMHLWARSVIYTDPTDAKLLNKLYLFVYCENAAWVWIDGQYVGTTNATNAAVTGSSANFDVTEILKGTGLASIAGMHVVTVYCLDEDPHEHPHKTYVYARVVTSPVVDNNVDAATLYSYRDMNPAHIIRECLTDQVWGMGYLAADVNDTSFTASADTLYAERFGLSIMWNKPGSILDFINEILRHINGTLYVNRSTGEWELTLVREGYDEDALVSLTEASIERIEDVSRRTTGELINQVSVSYTSSFMGDESTVTITEPGLVQSQGAIISQKIDYPGITTHDLASRVALRELRALSSPLLACTVIANREAASLNPGDPFKVTWSEYGMNAMIMRVASIELGDGRVNRVRIKCIEDVFASVEHNILTPPTTVWQDPTTTPIPVPDPVFVDTFQYQSTFMPASLRDPAVKTSVDAVFCRMVGASGGTLAELFRPHTDGDPPVEAGLWEEIRAGVWRARETGQAILEYWLDGATAFKGMRLLAAFVMQDEYPLADLVSDDKKRVGIYTVTDPGFSWDEDTRTYTSTYAQVERSTDFISGSQLEDGCVVQILNGNTNGGKYASLTTSTPITIGTTELEFERLDTYSPVRGDNLLSEAQTSTWGDRAGSTLNLSATSAEPGVWVTFPTMAGTPNAQTYPKGRTKWTVWCYYSAGDTSATTTIECRIVKYISLENVTVLATAETDPIVGGDEIFPLTMVTHADVNTDQTLAGEKIAVQYRLKTTSANQVVVRFRYGDMLYITRVQTPLVIGSTQGGFPSTPYGPTIALDGDGILTIPDRSQCSGEVRVSGDTFKGISIADAKGVGFVAGDKLSIRLTTNCIIHHNETVAAGAAGLNLSSPGVLTGDDADKPCGPRSHITLQYDDLIGQWEVHGEPTVMEPV